MSDEWSFLGESHWRRVRVMLLEGGTMPTRGSAQAAGLDLYSAEDFYMSGGRTFRVRTGVCMELPAYMFAVVAPRSGLSSSGVLVHTGVIDSDYRGEISVCMHLLSEQADPRGPTSGPVKRIRRGDRIAQLLFHMQQPVELVAVTDLTPTDRGDGGFGSTGR